MRLCQLGAAKPKEKLRKTKTPASSSPPGSNPQPHQADLGAAQPQQLDLGAALRCPGLSAGLQTACDTERPPGWMLAAWRGEDLEESTLNFFNF